MASAGGWEAPSSRLRDNVEVVWVPCQLSTTAGLEADCSGAGVRGKTMWKQNFLDIGLPWEE